MELAPKVLEVPLFTIIQLQPMNFDATRDYQMAHKMILGKVPFLSNVAMKEAKDYTEVQKIECIREQATSEAIEALRRWKGWKKDPLLTAEFDSSLHLDDNSLDLRDDMKVVTSYLANIPSRAIRERLH